MKIRNLLFTLFLLVWIQPALAQKKGIRTGTRLGVGTSQFMSNNFQSNPSQNLQFEAGGNLIYGITEYIGIRADLKLMYTSVEGDGPSQKAGIPQQNYVSREAYRYLGLGLPLQLRIAAPLGKISIYGDAGIMPQANLLATEKRTYDNSSLQNNYGYEERKFSDKNAMNFSFVYDLGLELDADSRSYFLEFSFYRFLSPLGQVSKKDVNVSGFTIGGGLLF
ncbi:MAG: outer membrane beta-barrel protein [Bacteroidetes bacterium]|nr:outer membrane beta-barrel protein [Bacteroidota bacterium]